MGAAADEIRAAPSPDNVVTYIIDRNINYTNVCNVVCDFCAFYRRRVRLILTSERSMKSARRSTRRSRWAAQAS